MEQESDRWLIIYSAVTEVLLCARHMLGARNLKMSKTSLCSQEAYSLIQARKACYQILEFVVCKLKGWNEM